MKHAFDLKRHTDVIVGQTKGKTLLPLPVGMEKIDEQNLDVSKYGLFLL